MNGAQIHLAISHFPIAGMVFSLIIFGMAFMLKVEKIRLVSIMIICLSAISALIMMESGEHAEEIVEHKPLVTKELIHSHEEAAEAANVAIIITAVLGIIYLVLEKFGKKAADKVFIAVIIANLASVGLVANAAHLGGQIRHDEIRSHLQP